MTTDPEPVFFALHVPKCAGSTIEFHMLRHLGAAQVWIPKKRWRKLPPLAPPLYKATSPEHIRTVRFVSGHYLGQSIERLFAGRPIRRSVLLRDPVSFHLSYYNFRMMRYRHQGLNPYSFETHLLSQPDDPMSHFLLSRWLEIPWPRLLTMPPAVKYDLINESLARFWFVADYRQCDALSRQMSTDLGISTQVERANTKEIWQSVVTWRPITREDLTPKQIEMIERRTMIDQRLWQTWRNAGHDVVSVRPLPLPEAAGAAFAAHELKRPYHSAARRMARGWDVVGTPPPSPR